jgi:phosphate transport system substrate-binding protein
MRALATLALALLVACGTTDPGGACVSEPMPDVDLVIAGSGSVLRLADGLLDAWSPPGGRPSTWLPESIGSTGGLEALADGAVDIALISRPLRDDERAAGLRDVPIARTAVVFGVHADVPVTDLSRAELAAILGGDVRAWPDGTPIVLLLREPGDSGLGVLSDALPDLADLVEQARADGRGSVLVTDQAMVVALASTPGALGVVVDQGLVHGAGLPVRAMSLDGLAPSADTVRDGRWPMIKTLSLALGDDASPAALAFASFAAGPDADGLRTEQGLAAP